MSKINVKHGTVGFEHDFKSIADIVEQIEALEEYRAKARTQLQMIVISTPKDITPEDEQSDVVFYIQRQTDELLNDIQQYSQEIAELEEAKYLMEEWEYQGYEDNIPALDLKKPEDLGIVLPETIKYKEATFNDKNPYYPKDYKNINEYINDCVTDIVNQSGKVFGKYYLTFDEQVIATQTNEFLYPTEEAATKAAAKIIGGMQFLTYDFVSKNPSFFESIRKHLSGEQLDEFDHGVELLKGNSHGWQEITPLFKIISEVMTRQLLQKIEIRKL